jgi:hypothetical protein
MRRLMIAALLLFASTAALPEDRYPRQDIRFGLRAGPDAFAAMAEAIRARPCDPANPVGVTLALPKAWAASPDWAAFDAAVAAAREGHARLCVTTALPDEPEEEATLAYLATLSDHAGEWADALGLSLQRSELSETLQADPDQLALTLKRLTASLRGESDALILVGDVAEEDLPLLDPLYERDWRAYVEGYASEATGSAGEPSEEVVRSLEMHHLGAPLLLHLPRVEKPIAAQLLVLASASRGVTYTDVAAGDLEGVWDGLVRLRSLLSPRMAPGFSTLATSVTGASGPRIDIGIVDLLDADEMVQGMVLVPRVANSSAGQVDVKMPTADVSEPRAFPLPDGEKVALGYNADQKKSETVLHVPWAGRPALILFNRLKTGTVGGEKIDVAATYRIPVEVILARHQSVQQPQDLFLENYRSEAELDYHFKLPGGTGSLDVTFRNTFFFQKGVGARWVQNQLLINGVVWKGETIPNLPIVEPEKVNTLPLMLSLGRDYSYRYIKDEEAEGHDCYVVEFIPQPGAPGSLYSGKVWIDKRSYVKIKMLVRQTGLQPPQVSNDETDVYAPFQGPDGRTYWLLSRVSGQQLFSVGGVNFVAERALRFGPPVINAADFSQVVAKAEASDKPMLQDTREGLRYLEKQKDGTRKLQMEPDTDKWLAIGGAYYDQSLDYPIPLVGVNYFSWDFRKTKTQVNLFAAGAVNTLTVSKVDLLPRVDGAFNGVLFAVPFEDTFYRDGIEQKDQNVKRLREYVDFGLGWRFTELNKLKLDLEGTYYRYYRASDTSDFFTLPEDHFDLSAGLTYTFAWRGLSLSASYEAHRRTGWEPWGLPGTHEEVQEFQDYALWSASLSKSFYLPYFQKIALGATWLDGKDLDRYSRYSFSYMGKESLSGFAGSGVRFDRGGIATLGYQFNVANVIRFGASVEQARVQPFKDGSEWQNHTGASLQGSVTGPWQTYWTLDLGYAVRSDIPDVEHQYTAALVVLKLW